MTLASALIQCYFDYSCSSLYAGLNKQLKHKLQVCQNKMVRFILKLGPRERIDCNILESLNMLNISQRVTQLRLHHVFNIHNANCPSYMLNGFTLVSEQSRYATRSCSSKNYMVPNNNYCSPCTFYYNAIKDWNDLPLNIKEISGKENFKISLKEHLNIKSRESENATFIYF